ncbi:MAG: TonB family protein [Acidobacteria bacterium]|nr:TonB family protein [Acidobacteriota bacterium]
MNTREQFGSYILLKKLSEDALGETFRAGRFGAQGIEQVVLLKVFNGRGLDGRELWQHVASRAELQGVLRSPNLASGIDFGEIQGVPFVAYDYISGKNLAALVDQANRQMSPLPVDHALLISERLALGLTAALETRLGGDRVLHGFVVPDLVMISNEGEAKLLGFEMAPGLRAMISGNAAVRGFERYLSPETLDGAPLHKADDVYSLGAILFEMLTGQALPAQPAAVGKLVDEASHDGEALPEGISKLLKRSLAPQDQRIGDAASWHKALSQTMIEGQYNPTTFNLAFYMHSLFRDEIEKESRELQVEKKIEPPTSTAEMAAATAGSHRDSGADTVMVASSDITPEESASGGSRKGLMAALAAVLLVVVAAGAWFLFGGQKEAPPSTPEPVVDTTPAEPAAPAGPTQEEIQAELERMKTEMAESLAAQSEEMQAQLSKQYESRLKDLQDQYEATKKAMEKKDAEDAAAQAAAEQAAKEAEAQAAEEAKAAAKEPEPTAPAENTAKPIQVAQTPPPPTTVAQAVPQKPAAKPAPPPPAVKEPAEPAVRRGDLVEPGPGVVPPRLVQQAAARYPEAARRFRREASISVRVLVDETGRVVDTEQTTKKVGLGLDEAAIAAAKKSTFQPATKRGVPVKMWHVLRFDFRP